MNNQVVLLAKMMELLRTLLLLSLTQWINQSNGLCLLRIIPHTVHSVGVTFQCSSQCSSTFSLKNSSCDLYNELAIEPCGQTVCSSRTYNLSTCITEENEITTSDMPQTSTPTTVHRTETTNGIVLDNCNTSQQSTTLAVLATMLAILIVLLVIVSTALIWTCWTFKMKEAVNRKFPQHRNTHNSSTTILKMDENPAYVTKAHLQRNLASENTSEPTYEIIPTVSSQIVNMSMQQSDREGGSDQMNTID